MSSFVSSPQSLRMPPPTNTDESKVVSYVLPDPLRLASGERVIDARTWTTKRRPEILRLFEQNQHGVTPSSQLAPRYHVLDTEVPGLGGLARRTQVRIRFSDAADTPTIRVLLYVPAVAKGPVPTLLHVGFAPAARMINETGLDVGMSWNPNSKVRIPDRDAPRHPCFPLEAFRFFIERGYGVAYVYYEDIEPDFQGGAKYGIRTLFGPQDEPRQPDEWGAVAAWAWGISRVLDYLLTNPAVNGTKVGLSGVSRLGKAVLWAAATDERFALAIPMLSGEGGSTISRRNYGESIADLVDPNRFPYWFAPRYADFAFDVQNLPVDGHMLLSLLAPRPVLQITGSEDKWADPKGEFLASLAAKPVYELFGKQGVPMTDFPVPNTKLLHDMGYFIHDGPHMTFPVDFAVIAEFLELHW